MSTMYGDCTVCIAVWLSVHGLHGDLCGMCLGRPSSAGLPTVFKPSLSLETSKRIIHEYFKMK